MILLLLISSGMCLTPKLSKYVTLLPFAYKSIECVPTDLDLSRLNYVSPILHIFLQII